MRLSGLSDLGERKAVELVLAQVERSPRLAVPFGDDVAGHLLSDGHVLVLKTDMLVSKTDVPPGMGLFQAARKAVVMNISDFAAKGVKPVALIVALGLPSRLTRRDVKAIAEGVNSGAREYGAYVLGGDTGESTDLVIAPSLFGVADRNSIVLRSGASPGDFLAVTGFFGKPSAGLRILMEGFKARRSVRAKLVDSVMMPHARLNEGLALAASGAVTSSIDSSDGLAWSIDELSVASKVGFVVDKLPLDEEVRDFALENDCDPSELALYGGEEYELVLTVKPKLWTKAKTAVANCGSELLHIGYATTQRKLVLNEGKKKRTIESRGWEHFRSRFG